MSCVCVGVYEVCTYLVGHLILIRELSPIVIVHHVYNSQVDYQPVYCLGALCYN